MNMVPRPETTFQTLASCPRDEPHWVRTADTPAAAFLDQVTPSFSRASLGRWNRSRSLFRAYAPIVFSPAQASTWSTELALPPLACSTHLTATRVERVSVEPTGTDQFLASCFQTTDVIAQPQPVVEAAAIAHGSGLARREVPTGSHSPNANRRTEIVRVERADDGFPVRRVRADRDRAALLRPKSPEPRFRRRRLRLETVGYTFAFFALVAIGYATRWGEDVIQALKRTGAAPPILYRASRAPLNVTFVERGVFESVHTEDVLCRVEGESRVQSIIREGTLVKKGDLLCQLDSSSLQERLNGQRMLIERAEAAYRAAVNRREEVERAARERQESDRRAELDVNRETRRGNDSPQATDPQARRGVGRVKNDRTAIRLSGTADDTSRPRGRPSPDERTATERARRPEVSRTAATTDAGQPLEAAKIAENTSFAAWSIEQLKAANLERQINLCSLYAPSEGPVIYSEISGDMNHITPQRLMVGTTVREGQKLFSLPDLKHMEVKSRIPASKVGTIVPGLRAQVSLAAHAGPPITGRISNVAKLKNPVLYLGSEMEIHTAQVTLDQVPAGIRPGELARVEIFLEEVKNALSVPNAALFQIEGTYYVFTVDDTGPKPRQVVIGISDGKMSEVIQGLSSGEQVALNPRDLFTDPQRPTLPGTQDSRQSADDRRPADASSVDREG